MKKLMVISLTVVAVVVFVGTAWAEQKITWRGQTPWPAGLTIIHDSALYFAKRVGELSNGRLVINMYPGGTIVPPLEVFEAAHKGTLDVSCAWSSYIRGSFPAAPLFGARVGGPEVEEYLAWALKGGGIELWQEMYDQKKWDVKVLPPHGALSPENLAWSHKPIRSLKDFKGLKFRTGDYYWGKVLQSLGASVVMLPGAEVVPSLERAVIDAAEWGMPAVDKTLGFHEICKYLLVPGIHQPSSLLETLVNKRSWEKLPNDLKSIVIAAAMEACLHSRVQDVELNPKAMVFFKKYGVEIITLPREVQVEAVRLANQVYDEEAAKDPFFAKVLKSQREWHQTYSMYKNAMNLQYD